MKHVIKLDKLITTTHHGKWCQLPYYNHKKGCPNYNKKLGCPPNTPHIKSLIDLKRPMYFVHSEFNLEAHVDRMKQKHPHWSDRQCKCVLYWQGTSRKQLKERVKAFELEYGMAGIVLFCPEAYGVNVYATCKHHGLVLDRIRHLGTCRHVALLGALQ